MEYIRREIQFRKRFLIQKAVPNCKIALDLGCGNGEYLKLLRQKASDVVGVDISKELCKCAKIRNPNSEIVNAVSCRLPFRSKSFDGVWASEVMEHSGSTAFGEVNRVARKWFLATMPNPYSSNYQSDPTHTLRYSLGSLCKHFKSWSNWKIQIKGMGIEYPSSRIQIPKVFKIMSIALTWHFPVAAPTFCIWGELDKSQGRFQTC